MTIREEMLQAARRARDLPPERRGSTGQFVLSRRGPDGGFVDRSGKSDLYYTLFGIECLDALGAELPRTALARYLDAFGDGEGLDLVHLGCLVRCLSVVAGAVPESVRRRAVAVAEGYRTGDGGYGPRPGAPAGTVYTCFLTVGLHQDLGLDLPDVQGVIACVRSLRAGDGGYANDASIPVGSVPATAAAATLLRHLGAPADPAVGAWLLAQHCGDGGFRAAPLAPGPDLLSTATALHALALMGTSLEAVRPATRRFVEG
ncbi:MAG: prenyltransferase/squalene oxidase repeat-containing protein, partial [Planctomycetota bacterium]